MEVVAMKVSVFSPAISRQNIYIAKRPPHFLPAASNATMADMNNIITQPPKHFSRAGIKNCLRQILGNQESMAHTFWEAFQSLVYRLDKHDLDFQAVRDRLWRIEHSGGEHERRGDKECD